MTSAWNHLAIYLIVALNAATQVMLIRRLKLDGRTKLKFSCLAVAIPTVVTMTMRLLVMSGIMHIRVADQGGFERAVTMLASILLVAGPPVATALAIMSRRKKSSQIPEGGCLEA